MSRAPIIIYIYIYICIATKRSHEDRRGFTKLRCSRMWWPWKKRHSPEQLPIITKTTACAFCMILRSARSLLQDHDCTGLTVRIVLFHTFCELTKNSWAVASVELWMPSSPRSTVIENFHPNSEHKNYMHEHTRRLLLLVFRSPVLLNIERVHLYPLVFKMDRFTYVISSAPISVHGPTVAETIRKRLTSEIDDPYLMRSVEYVALIAPQIH